jgi:hypothetical protein
MQVWPLRNGAVKMMTRRDFLRRYGIASSALTLSPFFIERFATALAATANATRVYKVKNGDCFQNTAKLWEMLDGPAKYIGANDVVVIKGNAQWPNQGYTHTGCIKGVIDQILQIPGFSGEVLICDNLQGGGGGAGTYGFDVASGNRVHNWPDKNWTELAADYRSQGKPVAAMQWRNDAVWRSPSLPLPCFSTWNPGNGPGWTRYFLNASGRPTYLSYPVFASPITAGRMIDMKNGVWENGSYTGRKVKAIFMPTLNNHGTGGEDYAGITSAVKSFFGASELFHGAPSYISDDYVWNGYYNLHSTSYSQSAAQIAGQMVGSFINNLYAPVLYITAAMWSGWYSRTGDAAETKTVLACEDPVTLDYIACRDVIAPYASWLNPNLNNNTRQQLLGCSSQGIGTIDPQQIEVVTYDFLHPTANRLDVDRKIRNYKAGQASLQEVKDVIRLYMAGP